MGIITKRSAPADPAQASEERTVARPVGPIAPAPRLVQPKRTRRPAMLALMVLTIVLGALGGYLLVTGSSQRTEVVGVARDIEWGQTVTAADLVAVSVVPDPALQTVAWADRSALIGGQAAVGLRRGALMTPDSLTQDIAPTQGQALVGLLVKTGQLPATPITAQDQVLLVISDTAAAVQGGVQSPDSSSADSSLEATVYTVGPVDQSGARTVDVLVSVDSAAQITQAAAAGRVSLVLVSRS